MENLSWDLSSQDGMDPKLPAHPDGGIVTSQKSVPKCHIHLRISDPP